MALEALRSIARALTTLRTPADVAEQVLSTIQERFGPSLSVMYLAENPREAVLLASHGFSEEARTRLARVPMATDLPLMAAMRSGTPVWCSTAEELLEKFPLAEASSVSKNRLHSVLAVPFVIDEQLLGGLALSFDAERALDSLQQEVLCAIGDLVAQAVDRHRLEQHLKRLHEATPDGVAVCRPLRGPSGEIRDFRYVFVNPTVAAAMQRDPAELVGRTLLECLPGLNETPFWNAFCRVANTGEHETYEQPYEQHGWRGWFRNTVVSLGHEIAVTYSDITAQRRAERRLHLLAEASSVLASSLDYDTTLAALAKLAVPEVADWATVDILDEGGQLKRLAVAHVDPAKVALGFEVTRRFPIDLKAPHGLAKVIRTGQADLVSEITNELIEAGIPNLELRGIVLALGLRSTICVPLKARGRVVGALSVFLAESARRYGEDDLRFMEDLGKRAGIAIENALHYRAAEEANRAKDEFLAIVSHELRTPLNAIIGWTHMLRTNSLPAERRAAALETIDRNARLQSRLIEDLLDVSRIVSDKLRLDLEPLDMRVIAERALETVRHAASARGVELSWVPPSAAVVIQGDPGRLQQVVWNLLSNAVKFSERGAVVELSARELPQTVEVRVRDRGKGIEAAFLPHVFERFRQADSSTTRSRGGLGLGLAIVRKLVELHGGNVRAESDGPGSGATFVVELPKFVPQSPPSSAFRSSPASAEPPSRPELNGVRVLVLDDEPDSRELVAALLSPSNAKVSTAANVSEALGLIQNEPPDVIVSDIGLPDEDGYSFIRKLRSLPPERGGRTPAIAVTAYAQDEERTRTLSAGFDRHLSKPLEPVELLATLASLTRAARTRE